MNESFRISYEERQVASDRVTDGDLRANLRSIDEGIVEITEGDTTPDGTTPNEDRVEELEEKLEGLQDQVDGETRSLLESASDQMTRDGEEEYE